MNRFQACGAALGLIIGAVLGALLCRTYGTLAHIGGAVTGGCAGMIVGALFVTILIPASLIPYAFVRAVATVYWELLTGRRKLPTSSTHAERRGLFVAIAMVFAAALAALAMMYLFGADTQRSNLLPAALGAFITCLLGVLVLKAHHRRHPARSNDEGEE